jgi:hypothetical protein
MKGSAQRLAAAASARDPLDAVPVASANARVEPLAQGPGIALVLREPAASNPAARLFQKLGLKREKRFELDAFGESYWSLLDGVRSLAQIHAGLCQKHQLGPEAARRSVIEFTATLMRRGLIGLETRP